MFHLGTFQLQYKLCEGSEGPKKQPKVSFCATTAVMSFPNPQI